jgi:hypothetical protein
MLRWSSKSRCRVQVTSNVRLPKTGNTKTKQDTRFGTSLCQSAHGKRVQIGRVNAPGVPRRSRRQTRQWPRKLAKCSKASCVFRSFASEHPVERKVVSRSAYGSTRGQAQSVLRGSRLWRTGKQSQGFWLALFPLHGELWQHPKHGRRTPPHRA